MNHRTYSLVTYADGSELSVRFQRIIEDRGWIYLLEKNTNNIYELYSDYQKMGPKGKEVNIKGIGSYKINHLNYSGRRVNGNVIDINRDVYYIGKGGLKIFNVEKLIGHNTSKVFDGTIGFRNSKVLSQIPA